MLEEIPFNLSEEINLAVELFKKQAEDKGLNIITSIKPEVA
jgi:signal transduction histidine kinase